MPSRRGAQRANHDLSPNPRPGLHGAPGCERQPNRVRWDRSIRCTDYNELEHCYSLRDSEDLTTRHLALGVACDGNYLDSCGLLYEMELERGRESYAFGAAGQACQGGSTEHCRIAVQFPTEDPELRAVVETERPKHQAKLDALEAGRPASEP